MRKGEGWDESEARSFGNSFQNQFGHEWKMVGRNSRQRCAMDCHDLPAARPHSQKCDRRQAREKPSGKCESGRREFTSCRTSRRCRFRCRCGVEPGRLLKSPSKMRGDAAGAGREPVCARQVFGLQLPFPPAKAEVRVYEMNRTQVGHHIHPDCSAVFPAEKRRHTRETLRATQRERMIG